MVVYVDDFRMQSTVGRINSRWSHLSADTKEELHDFARQLGLKESWFQDKGDHRWHYDVTDGKRTHAIKLGAIPITAMEMVKIMRTPGREGLRVI